MDPDQAALLVRALPRRGAAAAAGAGAAYASHASAPLPAAALAKVCARDYGLVMGQLVETTPAAGAVGAAAAGAPDPRREAAPGAAAGAATPGPGPARQEATHRPSPRHRRRTAAAGAERSATQFRNPGYTEALAGARVRVEVDTLRPLPSGAAAEQRSGAAPPDEREMALSQRSLETVAAFDEAARQSARAAYRVVG